MPVLMITKDRYLFNHPYVTFKTTCFDIPCAGRWSSIQPDPSPWPIPVCLSVWHWSRPLQRFQNVSNRDIIGHLEQDLCSWLRAESVDPITLSRRFMLIDHTLSLEGLPSGETSTQFGVLCLIFDYVTQIAQYQRDFSSTEDTIHLSWTGAEDTPHYPVPDLMLPADNVSDGRTAALLLLMRSPQFYDGSTDYMFEKYMKPALSLLFDKHHILFLDDTDCVPSPSIPELNQLAPLVVACGCNEFSNTVKEKMAAAAYPTLMRMVEHHRLDSRSSLPSFAFVYGVHWSPLRVSILVHFPSYDDNSGIWNFVQCIVAEHWASIQDTVYRQLRFLYEDSMFLCRWRLSIAFFTILAHVKHIKQWLDSIPCTDMNIKLPLQLHPTNVAPIDTTGNHSTPCPYLVQMRAIWTETPFSVPREWITSASKINIRPEATRDPKTEFTALKTFRYATFYLQSITKFLQPMSKEQVVLNHQQYSAAPDYIALKHIPRGAKFVPIVERPDVDTNAHLFKLHDLMYMQVTNWHDVNIFVANAFSGFASYGVRWRPQIQTKPSSHVIVDFALVVQKIAPTTDESICRALLTPPTITSPAILLGFRLCSMDNADGAVITSHDTAVLIETMTPYVIMASKHLNYLPHADEKSHNSSIVLATLLKAGYLHIIAFPPLADISASPQMALLDTIPLVMQSRTLEDRLSRVRLAIALFTLQRHVVRFSDGWDDTVWPEEAVHEEYERVIKPLGLCTPSPTANDEPDHLWWDDPADGSSITKIYAREFGVKLDTDDEEDEYEEEEDDSDEDEDEDEEDEEPEVEARRAEAALRIKARNENRWAWLKVVCKYFREWEMLEDMDRVERWVREYDPCTLDQMGVPLP